jgi:uncharacterized protein YecE (DUF72 family)
MIRFGPAGWEYPDWRGTVYPVPAPRGFDRLRFLAAFFGTVEVNATFYRPFSAEVATRATTTSTPRASSRRGPSA